MSKSLADNPFITEAKDKNGESWYHQIVLELKDKEIERLNNIINELESWLIKAREDLFKHLENEQGYAMGSVLDKLQELKGSESNE